MARATGLAAFLVAAHLLLALAVAATEPSSTPVAEAALEVAVAEDEACAAPEAGGQDCEHLSLRQLRSAQLKSGVIFPAEGTSGSAAQSSTEVLPSADSSGNPEVLAQVAAAGKDPGHGSSPAQGSHMDGLSGALSQDGEAEKLGTARAHAAPETHVEGKTGVQPASGPAGNEARTQSADEEQVGKRKPYQYMGDGRRRWTWR